jgi:hypothetical protein
MSTAVRVRNPEIVDIDFDRISGSDLQKFPFAFCGFLDSAGTATNRATHYNTKEEQQEAVNKIHQDLFEIDRGFYAMCLLLPVTDYTRQLGLGKLLDNPYDESILSQSQENKILVWLTERIPPHRLLNLYAALRRKKVNNSRTRKLILRSILGSQKIEFKTSGSLKRILRKTAFYQKEAGMVHKAIGRYSDHPEINQIVSFILGNEVNLTVPLLKAYTAAKEDLEAGKSLPYEILEGIRSRYHKDIPNKNILEMTKGNLTSAQKINMQRKSREQDVVVDFDPNRYDSVKLYVYAFEEGVDEGIEKALEKKAEKAANMLPMTYGKVSIIVDNSESMRGDKTQAMRPMACALATKDMLMASSDHSKTIYTSPSGKDGILAYPKGGTDLGAALIEALKWEPEAVFMLTDGYENAPSGRVNEIMSALKKMGNNTPIYQMSPVMAAESQGVRTLSPDISAMPLSKPTSVGLALVKSMIEQDVKNGIAGLARTALPRVGLRLGGEENE